MHYSLKCFVVGWVDVSWVQSTSAPSQDNSNQDNSAVKVVDISHPDVQSTISQVERKELKESKDSRPATFRVRSCRVNRDGMGPGGRRINKQNAADVGELENQSNLLRDSKTSTREIADLANLRLLMAVEDLLDNASSDLVASALAEAASLDHLRAASRTLQSSFLQNTRKSGSSQGSHESSSPPSMVDYVDKQNVVTLGQGGDTTFRPSSEPIKDDSKSSNKSESCAGRWQSSDSKEGTEAKKERSEFNIFIDNTTEADGEADKASAEIITGIEVEMTDETNERTTEEDVPQAKEDVTTDIAVAELVTNANRFVEIRSMKEDSEVDRRSGGEVQVLVDIQSSTEDKDDQVTDVFDTRSDEFSESDKNRQNERGRELPSGEGDFLFSKNSGVNFLYACSEL